MRRVPVESSAIASVGYDRATSVLEIEFADGDVYQYFAVPRRVHSELLAAESMGRYFQTRIRERYSYQRV
ncbi:MAG TPA: KTSC domain-containing protein [Jatrophihabitans sp.]|nr:KTSC domain-containing protein [Jatrophihabitans sp.]